MRRGFADDRVARPVEEFDAALSSEGAARIQSKGSPINQRECAGFNWPPPSISAEEPISISPEAVSRAGPLGSGSDESMIATCSPKFPGARLVRPISNRKAALFASASGDRFPEVATVGVCQFANCACLGN